MLDFGVSQEQHDRLRKNMADHGIQEHDIEESFTYDDTHHTGHNISKVENVVHLHHKPTGIKVRYHNYKHQGLNRYWARVQLIELVHKGRNQEYVHDFTEEEVLEQVRKHTKYQKEQLIDEKKHHSEIKKNRHTLREHEIDLEEV